MKTETQLRAGLAFSLLFLVILSFQYMKQNDELTKCKVNKDSLTGGDIQKAELQDSLFILQTNLGRYEIALEMLKEEDSLCAQKFEDILYTKTE
jgi:hypothetical protein